MRLSEFDFALPEDRIARLPAESREGARLLVLDRASDTRTHSTIGEFARFLRAGDLVVVNDVRVRPARIHLRRATGARLEGLIVRLEEGGGVRLLLNGRGRVRVGESLAFAEDPGIRLVLTAREGEGWIARADGGRPEAVMERLGHVPLPPYIRRARRQHGMSEEELEPLDRERYQTVFASEGMAVAAPTAGLHFGEATLRAIEQAGARIAKVRLEVGPGTFAPIRSESIEEHRVDPEAYSVPEETAVAVAATRKAGGRVVAVGTTVVRTLETVATGDRLIRAGAGTTDLYVRPGFPFQVVDALLTNFHLPQSSLLVLVAAFAGRERVLALYREAVREGYRFYSYGDATLFL